jgi:DNA-directed RNA polymerase alpha subunit
MISTNTQISLVQRTLRTFDLDSCKLIASWLTEHMKTLELDISVFNKKIQQLGLSTRALNVLKINGIHTIQQLIEVSADWDNIRKLKGAGEIIVSEIQKKVTSLQKEYIT